GIGLELNAQIMELGWASVAVILISILSTLLVSEWVSAKVRHAII
ncbi:MAG: phosphonate ABC transporter, permease protein PhnE, partial [Alphaproteobacteria bacterium]